MIRPRSLRPGDKIGIAGTGKKISHDKINAAVSMLTSWGLDVKMSSHLFSNDHSYFATSDAHRTSDLQQFINDPAINAIICARGGYGLTRIIDGLDLNPLRDNPKWIVGFSDVTALHLQILKFGMISIHGTMPILFSDASSAPSVQSLKNALFENTNSISASPTDHNRNGIAEGMVIGGNLSLIVDSLATSSEPDFTNAILIVEEIDEYLYKIDRMLTHLKRAGKLEGLRGLIVGHINDVHDTTPPFGESIEKIILDKVKSFRFPVAFGFPSGHDNPNLAWHHGSTMTLSVTDRGTVLESKLSS